MEYEFNIQADSDIAAVKYSQLEVCKCTSGIMLFRWFLDFNPIYDAGASAFNGP